MTDDYSFSYDGDAVRLSSPAGPTIEIQQYEGMTISNAIPLRNHVILLLEYEKKWGSCQNLLCIDAQENVVWRAPLLASSPYPKEYVRVNLQPDGDLVAYTWGGVRATISAKTGEATSVEFVK